MRFLSAFSRSLSLSHRVMLQALTFASLSWTPFRRSLSFRTGEPRAVHSTAAVPLGQSIGPKGPPSSPRWPCSFWCSPGHTASHGTGNRTSFFLTAPFCIELSSGADSKSGTEAGSKRLPLPYFKRKQIHLRGANPLRSLNASTSAPIY